MYQSEDKNLQKPTEDKNLTVICAWCRLLKNGVIQGALVWPEPYSPDRVFIPKGSEIDQNASHGICPECADKAIYGNKGI